MLVVNVFVTETSSGMRVVVVEMIAIFVFVRMVETVVVVGLPVFLTVLVSVLGSNSVPVIAV